MMSPKNLTESGFYPITFFVPLFIDGEKELGITSNSLKDSAHGALKWNPICATAIR